MPAKGGYSLRCTCDSKHGECIKSVLGDIYEAPTRIEAVQMARRAGWRLRTDKPQPKHASGGRYHAIATCEDCVRRERDARGNKPNV